MTSVKDALPQNALDQILQEVAPKDATNRELIQFRDFVAKMDTKQLHGLASELSSAARVAGRKIILREQLLSRLDTDWLRKQHEVVEGELAKIEVAKDIVDFNVLELDLSGASWKIGRLTQVLRLDEQAPTNPLIEMIKHREGEDEEEILGVGRDLDDEGLGKLFGV